MSELASQINQASWSTPAAARNYAQNRGAFPAERAVLKLLEGAGIAGDVLDIGVGAGRTTEFLRPLCKRYVGIDYSADMVAVARGKFPGADIRHADARALQTFRAGEFDVVWFSFNGLDYVSHADRLRILAEIHRVLAPGGRFVFSSHNRAVQVPRAHALSNVRRSRHPARMLRNLLDYPAGIARALRMGKHEVHGADYAILNDPEQAYRYLTYYITFEGQRAQLQQTGFALESAFGVSGKTLREGKTDAQDYCITYVCRRP